MKIKGGSGVGKSDPPSIDNPFSCELGYVKWEGIITVMHIKNYLDKCRWDPNMPGEFQVAIFFYDFGAPDKIQKITLAAVESINPRGLYLLGDVFIPYHRIRKIDVEGKTMWKKMPKDLEKEREVTKQFDKKGWRV